MEKYLENLNWRYATKIFDPSKKVSNEDLHQIFEVFRLSPSSYGLQPWKIFVVENKEKRNLIQSHARNQSQISESSHLLVFAKPKVIDAQRIEKYLQSVIKNTGASREALAGLEGMLNGFVQGSSAGQLDCWAREQVHLALGNVLSFLAEKRIDACPIGWFSKEGIDKILGLHEKGWESVVLLPIGYRREDDKYATRAKSRFGLEEIVEMVE